MVKLCDYCLRMPSDLTMKIQEAHLVLEPIFSLLVEQIYFCSPDGDRWLAKEDQNSMEDLQPALFLDRDGVVNREIGYLYKPEQVEFTKGIFELCKYAQAQRYKLIIITNQSGIARQLYSEADFHSLMQWMSKEFLRARIRVDGYYFCPHHPEHGIGPYRKECADRKPQPGMIFRASKDHGIDLQRSVLVGDRCSDLQAGATAGIGKLVLLRGTEPAGCVNAHPHAVVSDLAEIIPFLANLTSPA
ncbi:MAG: D-glycero-alpha-D-manno-heptose-1,7-bisphosphate 7-phosphatase [Acidobacteriaceae bacterium]